MVGGRAEEHDAVFEGLFRDVQTLPVAERPLPPPSAEHLVRVGVVDHADLGGVVHDERHGDAAAVVVLDEVRSAVDGVDDEELPGRGERLGRALFADEVSVWHDFQEALAQALLHLPVVLGDEVRAPALGVDVEMTAVDVLDEQAAVADESADRFDFCVHYVVAVLHFLPLP